MQKKELSKVLTCDKARVSRYIRKIEKKLRIASMGKLSVSYGTSIQKMGIIDIRRILAESVTSEIDDEIRKIILESCVRSEYSAAGSSVITFITLMSIFKNTHPIDVNSIDLKFLETSFRVSYKKMSRSTT